jgi:hypothetical protein
MSTEKSNILISRDWKDLYLVGFIAVILTEVILVVSIVANFVWPYAPGIKSTEEIFQLLQDNVLEGLLSLDLLLLLGNVLGVFLMIALFVALKPISKSWTLLAFVIGIVALVLIIPARPIPELFRLSGAWSDAPDEYLKMQYLIAGESLLAMFNGIAWMANTFLGGLSLMIFSILMLKHPAFGKLTAWLGIVSNILVCLFFVPVLGLYFLLLSVLGYLFWYFFMGRGFLRMWRECQ